MINKYSNCVFRVCFSSPTANKYSTTCCQNLKSNVSGQICLAHTRSFDDNTEQREHFHSAKVLHLPGTAAVTVIYN